MKGGLTLYIPDDSTVRIIECSPPSWACRIALEEKGVEYGLKRLSFTAGEHKTTEMLARNPRGTLPVLTHNGISLYETFAILEYIEFAFPSTPPLMPESRLRAIALTRLHESSNLKAAGMALFRYLMATRAAKLDHRRIDDLALALHDELFFWEHYYGMGRWAAGSSPTLPDFVVFAYVAAAVHVGLRFDEYPGLERFYKNMRARGSVECTWPEAWTKDYTFLAEANA